MMKFFGDDLYLDELRDRLQKLRKKSTYDRCLSITLWVIGILVMGVAIALIVKKFCGHCCECGCDDSCKEHRDDNCCGNGTEPIAHDDDFEVEE